MGQNMSGSERWWIVLPLLLTGSLSAQTAHAKSHCWKFTEFFSNADGTVQFIEWQEACTPPGTAEWQTLNQLVTSNESSFRLQSNLDDGIDTTDRWMLAGTTAFASLPGAPAPDFILPDGFINPAGDTIRYRTTIDIVDLPAGLLPTDGVTSVHRDPQTGALSLGPNDPINFADETGSVAVPAIPALGAAGLVVLAVCSLLLGLRVLRRKAV